MVPTTKFWKVFQQWKPTPNSNHEYLPILLDQKTHLHNVVIDGGNPLCGI